MRFGALSVSIKHSTDSLTWVIDLLGSTLSDWSQFTDLIRSTPALRDD